MTREEAIKALEHADSYVGIHYINGVEEAYINPHLREAVKVALTALRPVSREQVEKMGKGEWEDMREAYNDVPKRRCSRCKRVFIGHDKPFCEACGAPMTDEAVEMVMERFGGATR